MRAILAFDSGGSKCDALLFDEHGKILGNGAYQVPGHGGRSIRAVTAVARDTLAARHFDELHLVCSLSLVVGDLQKFFGLFDADRIDVHSIHEETAALALVGASHGVVVLAGTGAFVFAETADGRKIKLDGMGPLLGDEGSGYSIGRMAIRAAAKATWRPRHKTVLLDDILRTYEISNIWHLLSFNLEAKDRSEIARLARLVGRAAAQGDRVAHDILIAAAAAQAETLRDVVDALDLAAEELPMVGIGGVAANSPIYWQEFCRLAREIAPRFQPQLIDLPPVVGLGIGALAKLNPEGATEAIVALRRSAAKLYPSKEKKV